MFQAFKANGRYPNYLTLGWLRSDGDLEIVGTLNGETIDDSQLWNHLVEQTLGIMQQADPDTRAFARVDVVSVLANEYGEDFSAQEVAVERMPSAAQTVQQLRDSGHVVVVYTPEEIGKQDPDTLEDIMRLRADQFLQLEF